MVKLEIHEYDYAILAVGHRSRNVASQPHVYLILEMGHGTGVWQAMIIHLTSNKNLN